MLRVVLFVASLALFLPRLSTPADYAFDEAYHAFTAAEQIFGRPDAWTQSIEPVRDGVFHSWTHPPLGRIFIGLGIAAFGDRPFGWRIASTVAGALGVVLLFELALAVTGSAAVAGVAAAMLPLSGLWFVQARMAMLDSFLALFTTALLFSLHGWWTAAPDARRGWLLRLAACCGLALAVKWSAVFPVFAAIATVVVVTIYRDPRAWMAAARRALVLVVLTGTIYTASYAPYYAAGHGASDFITLQKKIAAFHVGLQETHPRQSRWWSWPLLRRPVWYWVDEQPPTTARVYAQGNPILFWAFVPAVAWLLRLLWLERRFAALTVVAIGFVGQWLPWAASPRMTFLYHFLPAVPFGCLAAAVAVQTIGRRVACLYVVAVAAAFVFFYPIYAAVPLEKPALERRIWFESWR